MNAAHARNLGAMPQARVQRHNFNPLKHGRDAFSLTGGLPRQKQKPRALAHTEKCRHAEGPFGVIWPRIRGRLWYALAEICWRGRKVSEPRLDRVPIPTVRTREAPRMHPPPSGLIRPEQEPETRATTGARESIGEPWIHG